MSPYNNNLRTIRLDLLFSEDIARYHVLKVGHAAESKCCGDQTNYLCIELFCCLVARYFQ